MTPQQRREYIAEKILGWTKVGKIWWTPGKISQQEYPNKLPGFESLPEWTGPICEVVLPLLWEQGWYLVPCADAGCEIWEVAPDWETEDNLIISLCKFTTALVDAHIKITGEKGE
jgi:hypothetical protein